MLNIEQILIDRLFQLRAIFRLTCCLTHYIITWFEKPHFVQANYLYNQRQWSLVGIFCTENKADFQTSCFHNRYKQLFDATK